MNKLLEMLNVNKLLKMQDNSKHLHRVYQVDISSHIKCKMEETLTPIKFECFTKSTFPSHIFLLLKCTRPTYSNGKAEPYI